MKAIYIAHSMTNGNHNLAIINTLINWLKDKKYKIIQPKYALFPDMLAVEAIKAIEQSKIVIADVTTYSHGVGFEMGYAYALKKKIIFLQLDMCGCHIRCIFLEIILFTDGRNLIMEIQ